MRVQVVVPYNGHCGEVLMQFGQQSHQGGFLYKSARVAGMPHSVQPTFVANADGVCVVSFAMCSYSGQRSPYPNGAIYGDVIVVSDAVEASLTMPMVNVLHRHPLIGVCGRAVDDGEGTTPLLCSILNGGEQKTRYIEHRVVEC